jgi:murein DD-endopeptidase MepM/ murein hydrolase activator NlpD
MHFNYLIPLSFVLLFSPILLRAAETTIAPETATVWVEDSTGTDAAGWFSSTPVCPVKGKVISPFGARGSHRHTGTDVKCKHGDTIYAAFNGKASMASSYFGYGKLIILQHEKNIQTYYSHLSKCLIKANDSVRTGQPIGLAGRTGRATTDHLHFEIRFKKTPKNSERYFNFSDKSVKKDVFSSPKEKADVQLALLVPKSSSAEITPTLVVRSEPETDPSTAETQPLESTITIRKGDTLYSLAKRYGTTVKDLQALNGMDTNALKIGMKLKVR